MISGLDNRAAVEKPRPKWSILPAADLHRHLGTLEALNRQGPGNPALNPGFLLPLLTAFGTGTEVLAIAEAADGPQALALLVPRGRGIWQTFQPSQSPIGTWIQRADLEIGPLLESLLDALPGYALGIGITQQDPDLLPQPAQGKCLTTIEYIRTARVTIDGSFEQYWNARGKNLKHNMKRQRNRLEKEGVRTTLEVVSEPDGIAQTIADYGQLESAGWKAEGGTAIHPDNAQGRFYRAMLEELCRQQRARVYRYRFNDRIVAVDLCIEADASLIILKTTHDETLKNFSPAFLMRQEAFGKLFEEGRIRKIEFYGRVMDWHTKWSDEVRSMYHINFYRWPLLMKIQRMMTRMRTPALQSEAVAVEER
jgi:CelD/BcsL family acetyltransferase involved in cellulose biosynthesis